MSEYRKYPGFQQTQVNSNVESIVESLQIKGYAILPNVLDAKTCLTFKNLMTASYAQQEKEFGREHLLKINEHPTHRGLVVEDQLYRDLIVHEKIWPVVKAYVGDTSILHLQNGSAAYPNLVHYQSAWHRDFAKDFISSKPLAINAFWCATDFTKETGATWVVPGTHKMEGFPSDQYLNENAVQLEAPAGSVFFWDSLLIHKAGFNSTEQIRFGVNNMYTRPFIKQQMDYTVFAKGCVEIESKLGQVLGFWTIPPKSVKEFRVEPHQRTYRAQQG